MAYEVPVTQARAEFADLVNRVVYGGERIVVTRHGKAIVALVPASDLERLDQLDQPEPLTVVRLSTEQVSQPGRPERMPERRLDVAAQHQPPGGG
ncbi:type II toxin-antitoxin system Phd/YefM family antitoxin [Actinomycetes bacterium KLBMP 9797]